MSARTPADVEERVWAKYQMCCNYSETAREIGIPVMTCWEIVQRVGGDSLGAVRKAHRMRAMEAAWEVACEGVEQTRATMHKASADEASRAALNIAKIADLMRSHEQSDKPEEPITVHVVHIGTQPVPVVAQDSTLPKATEGPNE